MPAILLEVFKVVWVTMKRTLVLGMFRDWHFRSSCWFRKNTSLCVKLGFFKNTMKNIFWFRTYYINRPLLGLGNNLGKCFVLAPVLSISIPTNNVCSLSTVKSLIELKSTRLIEEYFVLSKLDHFETNIKRKTETECYFALFLMMFRKSFNNTEQRREDKILWNGLIPRIYVTWHCNCSNVIGCIGQAWIGWCWQLLRIYCLESTLNFKHFSYPYSVQISPLIVS